MTPSFISINDASFKIIAKFAFHLICLGVISLRYSYLVEFLAPLANPIILTNSIDQIVTIATTMCSDIALITYNEVIVCSFVDKITQAYVANDVFFDVILSKIYSLNPWLPFEFFFLIILFLFFNIFVVNMQWFLNNFLWSNFALIRHIDIFIRILFLVFSVLLVFL